MKKILSVLSLIALFFFVACSGSKQAYKSVITPGYVKKNYQKIIVFAKLDDLGYRKKLEEAMVKELGKGGINAIPAYSNLEVSFGYDSVAFMKRMEELKVDGFMAITYLGQKTTVQDRYRYTGGYYNMIGGGAVPFDLETSSLKTGFVQTYFYNGDARTPWWSSIVQASVTNGIDAAIEAVSRETVYRLKVDKIL